MPAPAKVLIVGAGIIGLTAAWRAQQAGYDVVLLDHAHPGRASNVAAGILKPASRSAWSGDHGLLNQRSLQQWPALLQEIALVSRQPATSLSLPLPCWHIFPVDQQAAADEEYQLAKNFGFTLQPQQQVTLPELVDGDWIGLHYDTVQTINPPAVLAALRAALQPCLQQVTVTDIVWNEDTAVGVRTANNETLAADTVIWATGAFPHTDRSGMPVIEPVLGEICMIQEPTIPMQHILMLPGEGVLVPRFNGSCWVGSTALREQFRHGGQSAQLQQLQQEIVSLVPGLAGLQQQPVQWGWRPFSPDGRAFIGRWAPGLLLAVGHGREGILQAPLTAELLVSCLSGDDSAVPTYIAARRPVTPSFAHI